MPTETTPVPTTPVVGTAAKVTLLAKIETFFKDIGKDVVIDFADVKADIEALFVKHVTPATTAPPAPATPSATSAVAPATPEPVSTPPNPS